MKQPSLAVAAFWFVALVNALFDGWWMPLAQTNNPSFSSSFDLIWLILSFMFFFFLAFSQRHKPIAFPIAKDADPLAWVNVTAVRLNKYLVELKLYVLLMVVCFVYGGAGLVSMQFSTQSFAAYVTAGMAISGGLGILLACQLSINFPSRLI